SSATVWAEGSAARRAVTDAPALRPSLVPTWFTPHHCRYYSGGRDHPHLMALQPCLRPTSHCTCPFSPRNVRLGRLSPRRRVWAQEQHTPSGGVSHPSKRLKSRVHPSPQPSQGALPEAVALGDPCWPSPLLRGLSRPRGAALRLVRGRSRGGGAKSGFVCPIRPPEKIVPV